MRTVEEMMFTYRQAVREWLALQRIYNRLNEAEQQAMKIVQAAHRQYLAGMEDLLELSEGERYTIYQEERKEAEQRVREPEPA